MSSNLKYRTLARVTLEAVTPIKIGSGEKDIISDAKVALDVNNLPYIPGASIAGVLRHSLPHDEAEQSFGSTSRRTGSEIILSDAMLVYEGGKVVEGILPERTPYLRIFDDLPIRQHVRINSLGASERGGKFDETIVFAGARFCFEAELLSEDPEGKKMIDILSHLNEDQFRIGGGTRNGFGKIRVIEVKTAHFNLQKKDELETYLRKSSSLNDSWAYWKTISLTKGSRQGWETQNIYLEPDDFFLFASGHGDNDADITPTEELRIEWNGNNPSIDSKYTIVPASSIKGALAHRTAYHYNRLNGVFADQIGSCKVFTADKNIAVKVIFGDDSHRGNVIISDMYIQGNNYLFSHNSIDDYTGGTLEGHLFSEKVSIKGDTPLCIQISLQKTQQMDMDPHILLAFNCALEDLCQGMLALGNGSNKGHGYFSGKTEKF